MEQPNNEKTTQPLKLTAYSINVMKTKDRIQSSIYISIISILLRHVHINGTEYTTVYFWMLRSRDISVFFT